MLGTIVILNGAPRAGKSAIVAAIQATFDGVWMNLGVDLLVQATPPRYRPGIGLRPGGERPELEPLVATFYAALYDSIAAHSRLGLNVVVDVGHHDAYAAPRAILSDCARRLAGLPAFLVGVRCPIDVILSRRAGSGGAHLVADAGGIVPTPILDWQREVHRPGIYDLEVDTSRLGPDACAVAIARRLADASGQPRALRQIAHAGFS